MHPEVMGQPLLVAGSRLCLSSSVSCSGQHRARLPPTREAACQAQCPMSLGSWSAILGLPLLILCPWRRSTDTNSATLANVSLRADEHGQYLLRAGSANPVRYELVRHISGTRNHQMVTCTATVFHPATPTNELLPHYIFNLAEHDGTFRTTALKSCSNSRHRAVISPARSCACSKRQRVKQAGQSG
jgi:hypothetical protein